ncbi:hypothetical protein [Methylobacterium oryzae]|uniref:hypothetical protein n=1 Tax=Methylobacterium oryzae TaxID=334852 RepID=UPI002F35A968
MTNLAGVQARRRTGPNPHSLTPNRTMARSTSSELLISAIEPRIKSNFEISADDLRPADAVSSCSVHRRHMCRAPSIALP